MLSLLRFVFSMFVVLAHLAEDVRFFSHWGVFAVFGFYVISGYLMAVVLNQTYSFNFAAFALNRSLRLFPAYLLVAAATLLAIVLQPGAGDFHIAWGFDPGARDVLANALIVPFEFVEAPFKLVPPAWSVAAELINYFLLWLIIARSRKLAIVAVLLALAFHVLSLAQGAGWEARYFPYYAAILPFALGACLYFFKGSLAALKEGQVKAGVLVASLVWGANLVLCGFLSRPGGRLFDLFFYLNLAALVVIIGGVVILPVRGKPVRIAKIEKLLGDLAYPVFLCHWLVGFEISLYLLDGQKRGLVLFALSVIPILILSLALIGIESRWIVPLRNRIRQGAQGRPREALQGAAI
ncbi:acyltransferase family protein [Niveibacterium terrae]|uniref:acyltransferase family protein n=1 Tax=Niveibacterium terrae TaxID=3373598 RepID=UPI003A8DF4FF